VPVVPVAHNAGEFWRRNAFLKQPGEIIVSIGPAIEVKGRKVEAINSEAEAWIEGEMLRLFPHHYADNGGQAIVLNERDRGGSPAARKPGA
jgi:1-acyl-sn-glycerol-3-phosphate acyltransferase